MSMWQLVRARCLTSRAIPLLVALMTGGTAAACRDNPTAPSGPLAYAACTALDAYWPTRGWRANCPASLGLDTTGLRGTLDVIRDSMPTVYSFVVARHGYIALESYYHGARRGTGFELRSVTKAVTATIVGAAIQRGAIPGVSQLVRDYYPDYLDGDPRKQGLTLEHLLDLSAGFDLNAAGTNQRDFAAATLSRPLIADPGAAWSYDEALYHLLSVIVGRATGHSALALAASDVFGPLGIPISAKRWATDREGNPAGAGGLVLTAREMLSIGELYLHDGVWDGRRILPDGWVRDNVARRPEGAADETVYWVRGWRQTVYGGHLTYYALGYGSQFIVVVPDLEMVVVATADPYVPESWFPHVGALVRDHLIPAASALP
jgi:CubicO group peptidase (beta-lactamase class C family)